MKFPVSLARFEAQEVLFDGQRNGLGYRAFQVAARSCNVFWSAGETVLETTQQNLKSERVRQPLVTQMCVRRRRRNAKKVNARHRRFFDAKIALMLKLRWNGAIELCRRFSFLFWKRASLVEQISVPGWKQKRKEGSGTPTDRTRGSVTS